MSNFDWTPILTAIIGLIGSLAAYVWQKHARPWIDEKRLTEAAMVVVNAVEVMMAGSFGTQKLAAAISKLASMGLRADETAIREAIEAAYNKMYIEQVAAGVRDAKD